MHEHPPAIAQLPSTLSAAELRHLSDEQAMAELQAGNGDALAVLFDRYHRLVYSVALKIVRDAAEAEDVMQSVFFEIFRAAAQFDPFKGTCKVWLLQYAYHRAINCRRQLNAKNFYNLASMEDVEYAVAKKQSGFGRFTEAELRHLMQKGLAGLNAAQKRVIELASYQGLTMQEISANTGESLVNVRHHYYRGLKKLRSIIDEGSSGQRGVVGDIR